MVRKKSRKLVRWWFEKVGDRLLGAIQVKFLKTSMASLLRLFSRNETSPKLPPRMLRILDQRKNFLTASNKSPLIQALCLHIYLLAMSMNRKARL